MRSTRADTRTGVGRFGCWQERRAREETETTMLRLLDEMVGKIVEVTTEMAPAVV